MAIAFFVSCNTSHESLKLSGALETDDIDLVAPFTAELLTLNFEEGDTVKIGDTVAILDTTIVAATLRAAIAGEGEASAHLADLRAGTDIEKISSARSQLAIAKQNAAQADRDLARAQKMFDAHLIDQKRLEQMTLSRDNASATVAIVEGQLADLRRGARAKQIDAALAARERAVAEIDARRKEYARAFLIARESGVVHVTPFQRGEIIPAGKAVATLHNTDKLWANIYVPEARLDKAAIGDTVSFTVDAYPTKTFRGIIVHISSTAEFTPRNVQTKNERVNLVFAVKVNALSGQSDLRAGMPADFVLP